MIQEKTFSLPRRIKGRHTNQFKDYLIETNYYAVNIAQNIEQIYIYRVKFFPHVPFDNLKFRISLLQKAMPEIQAQIPTPVISGSNLYSIKPPSFSKQQEKEFKADDHTIKIKQVKVIPVRQNQKSLLMFLNNGLRNMFGKIGYTQIGKTGKFFKVTNPQNLDSDLKMFSGFKANFMNLEKGIYLRVDTAKKIVRNQTVLDFINQIYAKNKNKERDQKRNILKSQLIGQIVMTNYGKTRYLRVMDVVFDTVDELKLNGTQTSLRSFYQTKYHKKIQHAKQPLIQVQSKEGKKEGNKTILVPQLCLMTGIPENFDEFKRKKISQATIRSPNEKKRQIQQFMKQAEQVNDLTALKQIGIQIDKQLNQVRAKLIPSPKLQLGNNRSVENGREANFQLFRDQIFQARHSVKCGIFTTQNADTRGLIDTFVNTSRNLGIKFQQKTYTSRENDKNRIMSSYFKQIDYALKDGINICLIVIPSFMKNSYAQIKKQCLQKLNVVTQCVVDGTLRKKNLQSIATKLLLQMIAKRGNILWVPKPMGKISNAMIMAFDSAKGHKRNSIVCCATVNQTFSSYYSKTSTFNNNQDKFSEMVKLSLDTISYYTKKNSRSPKQIIIFHNSCTGDQMSLFRNFFLETLIGRLNQVSNGDNVPCITLLMVNTKTSERFFASDNGGFKNVNAGTIVADDIVSQNYDFYLVSQGSNRGSTVPNHYKVVFSNSQLEQGLIHQLAFSQCFNYVNWTGSIKIPGILQYAKKCAKFSAEALDGGQVQEDLNSKLYFV